MVQSGESDFKVPKLPELPKEFRIGLIVGPSGSGKTSILCERFGHTPARSWEVKGRKVRDYFNGAEQLQRLEVMTASISVNARHLSQMLANSRMSADASDGGLSGTGCGAGHPRLRPSAVLTIQGRTVSGRASARPGFRLGGGRVHVKHRQASARSRSRAILSAFRELRSGSVCFCGL